MSSTIVTFPVLEVLGGRATKTNSQLSYDELEVKKKGINICFILTFYSHAWIFSKRDSSGDLYIKLFIFSWPNKVACIMKSQ